MVSALRSSKRRVLKLSPRAWPSPMSCRTGAEALAPSELKQHLTIGLQSTNQTVSSHLYLICHLTDCHRLWHLFSPFFKDRLSARLILSNSAEVNFELPPGNRDSLTEGGVVEGSFLLESLPLDFWFLASGVEIVMCIGSLDEPSLEEDAPVSVRSVTSCSVGPLPFL